MADSSEQQRDFRGYGSNPPDPEWPGGARVAVSLVLNIETGAELSLADGDERNESLYEINELVEGVPDPCLASHFDYGPRVGYWRIMRVYLNNLMCPALRAPRAVLLIVHRGSPRTWSLVDMRFPVTATAGSGMPRCPRNTNAK